MVVWNHRLDGHEFQQTPGIDDGQESLLCCSPWGHKESGMTGQMNNNKNQDLRTYVTGVLKKRMHLREIHALEASLRLQGAGGSRAPGIWVMVIGDKGDTTGVHHRLGEDTYSHGPSDCLSQI